MQSVQKGVYAISHTWMPRVCAHACAHAPRSHTWMPQAGMHTHAVEACAHAHMPVQRACVHQRECACAHTCVHACTHTCAHACLISGYDDVTYVYDDVTYVYDDIRALMHARVPTCTYIHMYIYTSIHLYIYTYIHIHIWPASLHACMHACRYAQTDAGHMCICIDV